MSKIVNKAAVAVDKLINHAYWWLGRQSPTRLRNGEVERKPGEMLKYLSDEERKDLQDLKSEDLSGDRVTDEQAKMWADHTGYFDWRYYTNMLKEAKLKFDTQILKRDPKADRKKY